jgi:hypothetical protein
VKLHEGSLVLYLCDSSVTQVAQPVVCECKALRAHTRISAIQVSLIIIILVSQKDDSKSSGAVCRSRGYLDLERDSR